jgi:hypothetical protein
LQCLAELFRRDIKPTMEVRNRVDQHGVRRLFDGEQGGEIGVSAGVPPPVLE